MELHTLSRGDTGRGAEHRQPVVAASVEGSAAESGGNAPDTEAVRGRADVRSDPAQLLDDRLDPVRLLHPQLGCAPDDGLAASVARSESE